MGNAFISRFFFFSFISNWPVQQDVVVNGLYAAWWWRTHTHSPFALFQFNTTVQRFNPFNLFNALTFHLIQCFCQRFFFAFFFSSFYFLRISKSVKSVQFSTHSKRGKDRYENVYFNVILHIRLQIIRLISAPMNQRKWFWFFFLSQKLPRTHSELRAFSMTIYSSFVICFEMMLLASMTMRLFPTHYCDDMEWARAPTLSEQRNGHRGVLQLAGGVY